MSFYRYLNSYDKTIKIEDIETFTYEEKLQLVQSFKECRMSVEVMQPTHFEIYFKQTLGVADKRDSKKVRVAVTAVYIERVGDGWKATLKWEPWIVVKSLYVSELEKLVNENLQAYANSQGGNIKYVLAWEDYEAG